MPDIKIFLKRDRVMRNEGGVWLCKCHRANQLK